MADRRRPGQPGAGQSGAGEPVAGDPGAGPGFSGVVPPAWPEEPPTLPPPSRPVLPRLRWATPPPSAVPTEPVPMVGGPGGREPRGEEPGGEELREEQPGLEAGRAGRRGRRRYWRLLAAVVLVLVLGGGAALYLVTRPSPAGGPSQVAQGTGVPSLSALHQMAPAQGIAALVRAANGALAETESAVAQGCDTQPPASARRQLLVSRAGAAASTDTLILRLSEEDEGHLAEGAGGDAAVKRLALFLNTAARQASAYHQWLVDLQATGCYSAPTNNLDYVQGARLGAEMRALRPAL